MADVLKTYTATVKCTNCLQPIVLNVTKGVSVADFLQQGNNNTCTNCSCKSLTFVKYQFLS
jgi:hypothetical protein